MRQPSTKEWREKASAIRLDGRLKLPPPDDRRIRNDLCTAAMAHLGKDGNPRKNQISKALSQCSKSLNKLRIQLTALSDDSWAFAAEEDEAALLDRLEDLQRRMDLGAHYAKQTAIDIGETAGGPTRDNALRSFVETLGLIFKFYYRRKPTHYKRQNEDGHTSLFDEFVQNSYLALVPDHTPPKWGALNSAIQESLKSELDPEN